MNIIRIKNLTKEYGGKIIFQDVNLSLKKGEVIALIGPSGQGKSTLLKCISGLEKPTSGEVKIDGTISMVFQQFNLFKNMTVYKNIFLPLKIVKKFPDEKADRITLKILRQVGLENIKDSYPLYISGGQSQRAAIARALAFDPQIILFDEPTSSLDPGLKTEVLNLIKQVAKDNNRGMIIVTHEVEFAKKTADKIFRLQNGILGKVI